MLMSVENRGYTVPHDELDMKWKWVWGLNVTPKVKLFVWRLMHGILLSNLNLITRYVNIEPACKRCGELIESTEHAIRDCPCGYLAGMRSPSMLMWGVPISQLNSGSAR